MEAKNSSNGNVQISSETWWLDKGNHNRPFHSHWLQNNMTELDKKMEKILEMVEDGGDTFVERAEMYYQKRPQLIQMLQELHASYRDLANKYDLLMSRSNSTLSQVGNGLSLESESWTDTRLINCTPKHSIYVFTESNIEKSTKSPFKEEKIDLCQDVEKSHGTKREIKDLENDEKWNELKMEVTKLMEDNISYQSELIKRNDEKRESIKRLILENKLLKDSLNKREDIQAPPRSSYSKFKKCIFRKFSC